MFFAEFFVVVVVRFAYNQNSSSNDQILSKTNSICLFPTFFHPLKNVKKAGKEYLSHQNMKHEGIWYLYWNVAQNVERTCQENQASLKIGESISRLLLMQTNTVCNCNYFLGQVKLPHLLQACALCSELPSNIRSRGVKGESRAAGVY